MMRLLLRVMGRVIGKPNCHLGSIKLSVFFNHVHVEFFTITIPVLLR